jgi:hypothetical protein
VDKEEERRGKWGKLVNGNYKKDIQTGKRERKVKF